MYVCTYVCIKFAPNNILILKTRSLYSLTIRGQIMVYFITKKHSSDARLINTTARWKERKTKKRGKYKENIFKLPLEKFEISFNYIILFI